MRAVGLDKQCDSELKDAVKLSCHDSMTSLLMSCDPLSMYKKIISRAALKLACKFKKKERKRNHS